MEAFFPELLITYLLAFRQAFSETSFRYFPGFIFAVLIINGKKCVTNIAQTCFFVEKSLSSWERFLAQAQWSLPKVTTSLFRLLCDQLAAQRWYAGYNLFGVDTTFVAKVKGKMAGVQKWRQHSENPDRGKEIVGHHWVIGGLLVFLSGRWRAFPVIARLISGKQSPFCYVVDTHGACEAMNIWQATLAVIFTAAKSLGHTTLCVVVDAYFSKAPFLNPLIEKLITVVTRLRHDAVGFDEPHYCGRGRPPKRGKKIKLASLWRTGQRQNVKVHLYGKLVTVGCVCKDLYLRDIDEKVRVVVVCGKKRPVLLVSTSLTLSAAQIIEIYGARFSLEIAIRTLKQEVGFGDYQATTTISFFRFTQLCCVAVCIGQLMSLSKHWQSWLEAQKLKKAEQSAFSLNRLRTGLRRWVIRHLLFCKFANRADLQQCHDDIESIFRIAA